MTAPRKPTRGAFKPGQSGNPAGKPKGARNPVLVALDAIGSDAAKDVLAATVAKAKKGDIRAAEILLSRVWPARKGRPIALDIPPVKTAADLPAALAAITTAVASGELTTEEGAAFASLLDAQRRALEMADLAARIEALEARTHESS